MKSPRILGTVAVLALTFLAGSTLGFSFRPGRATAQPAESVLAQVLQRGTVIAGVTSDVPPWGFVDPSGNLVGFDIDMARIVAKALFGDPNKVELKKIAFPARWPAVNNGEVDFGAMVTTIWPDRLAHVNFTRGYIRSGTAILVRGDEPIQKISQLNTQNNTIAILNTPAAIQFVKQYLPKVKPLVLGGLADMLTALQTHRANAIMADAPTAQWRVKNLKNIRSLGILGPAQENAIFMRQNDFQWWWYLDTVVEQMRCGTLYEDYSASYRKWFGVEPPAPDTCLTFSQPAWQTFVRGK